MFFVHEISEKQLSHSFVNIRLKILKFDPVNCCLWFARNVNPLTLCWRKFLALPSIFIYRDSRYRAARGEYIRVQMNTQEWPIAHCYGNPRMLTLKFLAPSLQLEGRDKILTDGDRARERQPMGSLGFHESTHFVVALFVPKTN